MNGTECSEPIRTLRLVVCRHGEMEANVAKVAQGQAGGTLTCRGEEQARALGAHLRRLARAEAHVLCSDLARCQRTAELADLGAFTPEPLLRERHAGSLEGSPILARGGVRWCLNSREAFAM